MDINNFEPFNSNTWGSVSDWAMVMVTALTAWFLWRTLQSQQYIQRLQQDSIAIEKYNHRINIRPRFTVSVISTTYEINEDILELTFHFRSTSNEQIARNVVFEIIDEKKFLKVARNLRFSYNDVQPNSVHLFSNILFSEFYYSDGNPAFWVPIDFVIKYTDIEDNKYIQKFSTMVGVTNDDNMVIPYEPELII